MPCSELIIPIILAGGTGSRLWPISSPDCPKHLLQPKSEESLFQRALKRLDRRDLFARPVVVTGEDQRILVAEQLRASGIVPRATILEPISRNTAAALTVASLAIAQDKADALVLAMPSDLAVGDVVAFYDAVEAAAKAAANGNIVRFAIAADQLRLGYGVIRCGAVLPGCPECFSIESYSEFPAPDQSVACVGRPDAFWNTGILLFPTSLFLMEVERLRPGLYEACRAALAQGSRDADFWRLDPTYFNRAEDESVGSVLGDKTNCCAMIPVSMGWSDLGAWDRLWEVSTKDADGNVLMGDVATASAHNCYIRSEAGLVAVLGVNDLIVVATAEATLVVGREHAQHVKELIARLKGQRPTDT